MLMASRLLYGLANQDVLPRALGKVSKNTRSPYGGVIFSTLLALGLIYYVANNAESDIVLNLASITALLLLGVFTSSTSRAWSLRVDGRRGLLQVAGLHPGGGRGRLPVPDRAVGRPRRADLQDRRRCCC